MGKPPKIVIEDGTPVVTGYTPRPLQYNLHRGARRFTVVVCHRRFGKTVWAINHLVDRAIRHTLPNPRFFYVAPTYGQAKRIAWDYLKEFTKHIPGVEYNEAELRVELPANKARIQLLSSENPGSLRGMYADGLILDEFAEMDPSAWTTVMRPTLSDRKGWAIFLGTPKGQNHFYEFYEYGRSGKDPEWVSFMFKASETKIIRQDELDSARRMMTEEEYEQEYECSFTAGLVGAYFAKELSRAEKDGRITAVPHDPSYPVDTYWDLGINDMAAVWFVQTVRGQNRIIDYYEISGASIPEVLLDLRKKPYNYGEFVLPHDAKARDFSTGKTQMQVFHNHGVRRLRVLPRVGTKRESINAARMIFPMCVFDGEKCKQGLKCLANYQRKWDAKNNVFQDSPLHNWASNGADAFQQFALGSRGDSREVDFLEAQRRPGGRDELVADTEYNPFA